MDGWMDGWMDVHEKDVSTEWNDEVSVYQESGWCDKRS